MLVRPLGVRAARPCAALFCLALVGCGGASSNEPAAWLAETHETPKIVASGTALERFFPLVDGMLYQYVTENELGEQGLLVARVLRDDAQHGALRFPSGQKRFAYLPDGIALETAGGPVYLLKDPVAVGQTFRGEHGGTTRVIATSAAIDVPAGHYDGCIQTLEERGGDSPIRYATTYCPGVGVVQLEAASRANFERASLKSYAAPVQMKPDGLDRFEVTPSP